VKPELFRSVWSWLGLVALTAAGTVFLRTTGLAVDLPLPGLGEQTPYGTAVLGLPACTGLTLVFLWLTKLHAQAAPGSGIVGRLPVALVDPKGFEPGSAGFRVWQHASFAALCVLPPLLEVLIFFKVLDGTVSVGRSPAIAIEGYRGWGHFWPPVATSWGLDYQLDGPTYFPFLTPLVYLALVVAVLYNLHTTVKHLREARAA
jgi:hypothetical protein